MLTATARANAMALQVLIFARLHNDRVVTHDLVDAVMSRDADTEQGKANKETVRRIIRARAASEFVRVIFTEVERYWAIREKLHHMDGDAVHALRDSISDGGDLDPRGDDRALIDAISIRLSNRLAPARLDDCKPVSVRLWREPRPEGDPGGKETTPAEDEKTRRWAEGFAAKWWAEQNTGEPTDAALAAVFAHTVKPPKREAYPLIREAITALTPPAAAAPLFAAHAAREAVEEATDLAPASLHRLVNHLEILPLAAPPALHERLRAARGTAEGAWESLRVARSLPAKTAARSVAKDAIVRARAAILAVQPHAGRMHGTDMPHTTDSIRAAALAYMHVGATPDETDAIKSGTAEVRVDCRPDTGTGWMVTARVTAGIRDVGWFLPAHPPIVVKFRRVDGRTSPADNARKVIGSMLRVDVPVKYKDAARR
ncbi:hypothetical protein ACFU96_21375 [Streptomyces sp. NPDC057620]|uniref:hypothetical protein n=1 Tax=Streptomyces sp. NPDC057620 TaxID=3346185 RepID=UPI0036A97DE3